MAGTFSACNRVLEDGRFIIVNVSPVITRRPGREFESIRYLIHYDLHRVLTQTGYYFVDEILWVKPEPSVPDRVSGYRQTLRRTNRYDKLLAHCSEIRQESPGCFPGRIMPESLALLFVRGGRGARSFCGFRDIRKSGAENGKDSRSV